MRISRFVVAFAGLAACCLSACAEEEKVKGELIISLQTDMELPKDVDKVRIRVASYGNTVFSNDYPVGPSELRIPATLAVFASPERPTAPATIQVIGFRKGTPRVMRETVTTVPIERIATLRMPIEWLCDESARNENGEVLSNCPSEQTCIAGTCTAAFVDSEDLPDYQDEDIFGGGNGSGNGTCFDVGQCFSGMTTVTVDKATCRASLPADDPNLSFALKLPGMGDGICTGGVCLIPLDGGEGGQWSRLGAGADGFGVQFATGVCEKLQSGKAESVLVTNRCAAKTAKTPPCGAWSSTGGSGNTVLDAGGGGGNTLDAGTGTGADGKVDAGATDDGGSGSTDAMVRPDGPPMVDGGAPIDASSGLDTGTTMPPDTGRFDGPFSDGACMGDNCGPPPNCAPPPPPADGGFCSGIPSQPPSNAGTPCQWDAPGRIATSGAGFCPNLLNLMMLNAPGMPGPIPIPQVPEGQCGSSPGWQFISAKSIVDLCPTSCAPVSGAGATVEFIYGCPTMGPMPDGGMGPPDGGGMPPLPDGSGIPDGPPPPPPDASIDADGGLAPMVFVLGGVFPMGCASTDMACNSDETSHMVTLSDYSIDETEVTQAAWDQCIRASVCVAPPCSSWQPSTKGNWPVTCVNRDEAASYCAWMGRRLPTEAEWEIAARGTMGDIYPWGMTDPDCTVANFGFCSFGGPQPVRYFPAGTSPYNAFDMAGNVAEWVSDWYALYEGDATNPTGPPSGNMRVVRGGDFQSQSTSLRASYRGQTEGASRSDNIGFRCAKPGF